MFPWSKSDTYKCQEVWFLFTCQCPWTSVVRITAFHLCRWLIPGSFAAQCDTGVELENCGGLISYIFHRLMSGLGGAIFLYLFIYFHFAPQFSLCQFQFPACIVPVTEKSTVWFIERSLLRKMSGCNWVRVGVGVWAEFCRHWASDTVKVQLRGRVLVGTWHQCRFFISGTLIFIRLLVFINSSAGILSFFVKRAKTGTFCACKRCHCKLCKIKLYKCTWDPEVCIRLQSNCTNPFL